MLDGSGSTDDGTIVDWIWDFDDGSLPGVGATVLHTFTSPGVYDVTLTVGDGEGALDTTTVTVTVGCAVVATPVQAVSGTAELPSPVSGTARATFDVHKVTFLWWSFHFGTIRGDDLGAGMVPGKNVAGGLAPAGARAGVNGAAGTAWALHTAAWPWKSATLAWSVDDLSTGGCGTDVVSLSYAGGFAYALGGSLAGGDVAVT